MYLSYDQEDSDGTQKTVADLTVPANATHVEIQADTQPVRYAMDDVTALTAVYGMIFLTTSPPKTFLIEDLRRIRFTESAGGAGFLNFHYFAGRDV